MNGPRSALVIQAGSPSGPGRGGPVDDASNQGTAGAALLLVIRMNAGAKVQRA